MGLLGSLLTVFKRNKPVKSPVTARVATRLLLSEPVRFTMKGSDTAGIAGMVEDISETGACLHTHQKLSVGDRITLRLNVGRTLECVVPARVVHARREPSQYHFRYGLRFAGLGEDERQHLAQFVSAQKSGRAFGVRAFSQESDRQQA